MPKAAINRRTPNLKAAIKGRNQKMAQMNTTQLARLCNRIGTSLRAGIDARTVFQREAQRGGGKQRDVMDRIARALNSGESVTSAFSSENGYFPPLLCEMLAVGEKTGKVDEVFLQLGEQYQHILQLRRNFLIGITWPAIQLTAAFVVIGLFILLMGTLVPLQADGTPVFDLLGIGVGVRGLINYLVIVGMIVGAVAFLIWGFMTGRFGPWPMQLLMRAPMIGKCLEMMALSRMAWALAMANNSGMDTRRSVKLALRSTNNPYYGSQEKRIDRMLADGAEIHEAFALTRAFPSEFVDVVSNGELSGTLPESLLRLSQDYQSRARSTSGVLTVFASFAVWGLVAIIIIIFIFKFAMFYLNAINPATYGL
jgi:type IV pilus assembly protein PilC